MTYKELTKVKISDSCTYALIHGILNISESNKDMDDEDVKLLQSWGWQRLYYSEINETSWKFQMNMVEK